MHRLRRTEFVGLEKYLYNAITYPCGFGTHGLLNIDEQLGAFTSSSIGKRMSVTILSIKTRFEGLVVEESTIGYYARNSEYHSA